MNTIINIIAITLCTSLFTACTTGARPGSSYGKVAPQLVMQKKTEKNDQTSPATINGKILGRTGWDHPEYFGPVPSDKVAESKRICRLINANRAIGYHPRAKDLRGNVIKGGGYYCVR